MNCENVASLYDLLNEGYRSRREEIWGKVGSLPDAMLVNLITKHFGHNKQCSILDAGCGYGADLEMLREFFKKSSKIFAEPDFQGIDISSWMVDETRGRGFKCEKKDFSKLKGTGKRFDVVWCNMCLMHFPLEEVPAAIENLKSVLSKSGILGVGVKTLVQPQDGLGAETINPAHGTINIDRHMTYFNEFELRNMLTDYRRCLIGHITLPSEDKKHNYSWIFVGESEV